MEPGDRIQVQTNSPYGSDFWGPWETHPGRFLIMSLGCWREMSTLWEDPFWATKLEDDLVLSAISFHGGTKRQVPSSRGPSFPTGWTQAGLKSFTEHSRGRTRVGTGDHIVTNKSLMPTNDIHPSYLQLGRENHSPVSVGASSVVSNSCNSMDYSLPVSSVQGVFQARKLEWVAISFSRGSSWSRDRTCVSSISCLAGGIFTTEPPWKAKPFSKQI